MKNRTFIRSMLDLILNNPLCKAIQYIVNFCEESSYFGQKKLKFIPKMPIRDIRTKNYKSKFIFHSEIYKRNHLN